MSTILLSVISFLPTPPMVMLVPVTRLNTTSVDVGLVLTCIKIVDPLKSTATSFAVIANVCAHVSLRHNWTLYCAGLKSPVELLQLARLKQHYMVTWPLVYWSLVAFAAST
jgi:hypothetical protein